MKTIGYTYDADGKRNGIISGADFYDQQIVVNGRIWRFEFDRYLGPFWLRKDGEPRKCQVPTIKAVWDEFEKWQAANVKDDRPRIPQPPPQGTGPSELYCTNGSIH